MRETCLQMIYELSKQDDRILSIGSDLTAGTLAVSYTHLRAHET